MELELVLCAILSVTGISIYTIRWAWWLQAVPQAFKVSFDGVSYEKCTGKWLSTIGNAWFFVVFIVKKKP